MSLLIKALRQAEKQNEQAAKRAAEVAIDLPPEATTSNSPLSSALNLAVEAKTTSPAAQEQQSGDTSDFPTLDEDFAGVPDEDMPVDKPALPTEDQLSPLSLEQADKLPAVYDDDVPPELFARHSPAEPIALAPEPEPLQVDKPSHTADSTHDVAPAEPETKTPKTAQAVADDPAIEAAPYLAVKAALPKRRFVWTPLTVLISLPIIAFILALVAAATTWWSSNQVYDVNFDAPAALQSAQFAVNDQPLSRLNLGVAVEGTGATEGRIATETTATTNQSGINSPAGSTAGSSQAQTEQSAAATPSTEPAAPRQESSPPPTTTSAQASTAAPVKRELSRQSVAPRMPAAARPALPAVRFVRSVSSGERSQQLLNDAYQALQRNELDLAKSAYQQALRIDRNLIDGWVGLASVAARQGDQTLATQHYQRALNIDPNDRVARTGLLALAGSSLPEESESTLRTLIGSGQKNAMAELTLANTLARQGRWAEAQQAYFNANTVQPNQPDTVFNLAVSLERLRQPRAALTYYERALALSESRQALFDPALASQRIKALKQQLQEQ